MNKTRKLMKKNKLTTQELAALAGQYGDWTIGPVGGLIKVRVKIVDARQVYGRLEYLVTPLKGSGEAWVQSVELDKEGA
jgi:hypothetical protein